MVFFKLKRMKKRLQPYVFYQGIIDGTIAKNGSKTARVIHITSHPLWKSFYENLLRFIDFSINIKEYKGCLRISIYKKEFINKLNMFNCPKLKRKWMII